MYDNFFHIMKAPSIAAIITAQFEGVSKYDSYLNKIGGARA